MSHAFGTQNIRHSEHRDNLQAVLRLIRARFPGRLDVLAMQELTGAHKAWLLEAMPGWRLWWKQAPTNGTGLMWRTDRWAFVKQGLRMIYKPGRDGPVEVYDGDPKPAWRRYASWVTLRDRVTGQVASFISVHGKLGAAGKPAQWRRLRRLVTHLRKSGIVQLAGDLNAGLSALPDWLRDKVGLSQGVDHIAVFGDVRTARWHRITKARMRRLVDHPGAAHTWAFRAAA